MNSPIKKRSNPFATPKTSESTEEKVNKVEEIEKKVVVEEEIDVKPEKVEEIIEETDNEVEEVEQIVKQERNQPKHDKKKKVVEPENDERIKYTSTMDKALRRKIKIVCATQGIMFSEFIENACREKLKREGEL